MMYCMENIGRTYVDESNEKYDYDFYARYLTPYERYIGIGDKVYCDEDTNKAFLEIKNLYEVSKSRLAEEWQEEEKAADGLMFFISCNVVGLENNKFYINVANLKKKAEEYSELKNKKVNCLKKGALK